MLGIIASGYGLGGIDHRTASHGQQGLGSHALGLGNGAIGIFVNGVGSYSLKNFGLKTHALQLFQKAVQQTTPPNRAFAHHNQDFGDAVFDQVSRQAIGYAFTEFESNGVVNDKTFHSKRCYFAQRTRSLDRIGCRCSSFFYDDYALRQVLALAQNHSVFGLGICFFDPCLAGGIYWGQDFFAE